MTKLPYSSFVSMASESKLNYFLCTLSRTNRTPTYYVNWQKVERETKKFEIELNTLNYLIGKKDIYNEALELFNAQPNLIKAIPSLIASRDKILDLLFVDKDSEMDFYQLDFININENNIKAYVDFSDESGLLNFLRFDAKRSLVDYVYGVEVGLDSNARKNRSGSTMETILQTKVEKISRELGFKHCAQVTAKYINDNWNVEIPVDKSYRRFDEAVFDPKTKKVWVIETNYYGGGGSKLKSVAGEFSSLNSLMVNSKDNVTFVWVTDGQGWKTAKKPLLEAFGHINNIFNLEMLKNDYLDDLFKQK